MFMISWGKSDILATKCDMQPMFVLDLEVWGGVNYFINQSN